MASVYQDILTQVKADLDAVTFPDTVQVLIRKALTIEQDDTLPLIVIAPMTEYETDQHEGFENVIGVNYPVAVGIAINPGLEINGAEEFDMLEYRQQVRRTLRAINSVAPTSDPTAVVVTSIDFNAPFDRPARRDDFDWSALMVNYMVIEPRND